MAAAAAVSTPPDGVPDTEHARLLANATPEQMAAIMRLLRGQENGVAATAHQESPLIAPDAGEAPR